VSTKLVNDMRLRSRDSETVLRAIVKLVDSAHNAGKIHVHEGRAWTTAADIVEYVENNLSGMRSDLTLKAAARVLRHFATDELNEERGGRVKKSRPPGDAMRKRWTELDLGIVYEQALHHGINTVQVRATLLKQPGGEAIVQAIEDAQE
jgi:hypothetical protein